MSSIHSVDGAPPSASEARHIDAQRPLYEIKANLFKGLAHPYRIRVLEILSGADEASVSDIIALTGLEASHLSQHLAVLRRYGLVRSERRASVVYYRLAFPQVPELLRVARQLLSEVLNSSKEQLVSAELLPAIPAAPPAAPSPSNPPRADFL
jgi:DNA-binding transcriptional ArsR family regulator